MKNSTLVVLFAAITSSFPSAMFAQGPNSIVAPNIVLTDIDGVQRNMYSYLDQGKTVVIDMFATWCAPCADVVPAVEAVWNLHGPSGDNTVQVLAIELDPSTNDEPNWRNFFGITYPVIRDLNWNIFQTWHPQGYPTFAVICPDRSWQMLFQNIGSNPAPLLNLIGQCPANTASIDARAVDYRGPTSACGEPDFSPRIRIQNLGSNTLTSCDIETWVNGTLQTTYAWTGSLPQFQMLDGIALPSVTGLGPTIDAVFKVTNVNGGVDDNPANNEVGVQLGEVVPGTAVTLSIRFDQGVSQIRWDLFDEDGNIVHTHDWYDGAVNPPGSTYTETWILENLHCYRFEIHDYIGDGLCCTDGIGNYRLMTAGNQVFHQGGQFDHLDVVSFVPDVSSGVGEQIANPKPIDVFPNPGTGILHVQLPFDPNGPLSFEVFDMVGARVAEGTTGSTSGTVQLNFENLADGAYMLGIGEGGQLYRGRFLLVR